MGRSTLDLLDLLEAITEIRVEQPDFRSSVLACLRLVQSLGHCQAGRLYLVADQRIRALISHGANDYDEEQEQALVLRACADNETRHDQNDCRIRVLRHGKRRYGALILERCQEHIAALLADLFLQWSAVAEFVAIQKEELIDENYQLREEIRVQFSEHNIIGISGSFQHVLTSAKRVAASSATVLIEGETGTGKEVIARLIHEHSPRSNRPFITVNCSALSESLLESELFGHVKGAFTGATADRKGRFEAAHGGTVFLDEIGEISANMQVKLLRVLQELEVVRVGDHKVRKLDVRVITATNRSLEEEVRTGSFRSDLFYRLNVVYLHMPPLRERIEDIALLIEHFLGIYSQRNLKYIEHIDRDVLETMKHYPWPGNVRELENCIEKMVVMAPGKRLSMDLLPMALIAYTSTGQAPTRPAETSPSEMALQPVSATSSFDQQLSHYMEEETRRALASRQQDLHQRIRDKFERHLFDCALDHCENNKSRAAELLGITRTTLAKRLKSLCTVKREWLVD